MVVVFDVKFNTMDLDTNSMAKPMKVKTLWAKLWEIKYKQSIYVDIFTTSWT